jgi:hypothetical protein
VDLPAVTRRELNRKPLRARAVDKDTVGKLGDPSFRTSDLLNRLVNGTLVPAPPCTVVVSLRPIDGLITEDEDVVSAHNEKIAEFLSITPAIGFPINEDVGVGPQV